jgi:hypothetical protein
MSVPLPTADGARFRFGSRERRGAMAGWRPGQIGSVAVGLLVGVVALHAQPNAAGVVLAVGTLAACVAAGTWPVSGRTGDQWLPVVVLYSSRRLSGARATDVLGGVSILGAGARGHMGVAHDRRGRTLTAALALRGRGFALLGVIEQDRRVTQWAAVLASVAREGSPVRRLQWVAASVPDDGRGVRSHLSAHRAAANGSACLRSYEDLLDDVDLYACAHDVVLSVQVRAHRSVEASAAVLQRELHALARHLADADIEVEGILSPDDWVARLSRTYEPKAVQPLQNAVDADPWPMAIQEQWAHVRVDGLVHCTFWVAEWPRTDVRSDFLAPLLLTSARATLSVVMEPLGPEKAVRKAEASRTADLADAELRRRGGFIATARHARDSEMLARRESELADGHASFRYAGFVTVSAVDEAALATACDTVQHAANQARLVLRRQYGEQAAAYACTLPFGRGLAGR